MTRYIIETATGATRRTLCDVETIADARTQCDVAMSVARVMGGPDFAFAIDETGHYCVAIERTEDGRILNHVPILDHLAGR